MGVIWNGLNPGPNPDVAIATVVTHLHGAPSINPYTLMRLDWTVAVRAHITSSSGIPENWWVGSEVLMDLVFCELGVDETPDINGTDERLLYVASLQPRISWHPTSPHHSVVWESTGGEWMTKGRRKATTLGSEPPAVAFHFTCTDDNGVFVNSGLATNRLFAVDMSSRALWRADF